MSRAELARLLAEPADGMPPVTMDPGELRLRRHWLDRLTRPDGAGRGARLVVDGAASLEWDPRGDQVPLASGRLRARGLTAAMSAAAELERGRAWAAASGRLLGRVTSGGQMPPPELLYDGWPTATGRPAAGEARTFDGPWRVDWPRLVAGVQLGRWALAAGWAPRSAGPGLEGGLTLSEHAPSFPALTLRRTAPLHWRGPVGWLAPEHLLVRGGLLDRRAVRWEDERGRHERADRPWFVQWLVTWNHTRWLRTTVTQSAVAAPRRGTLWADLPQVAFPLVGATDAESERGPLTDRIFALQFEGCWRRAPWPLLPAAAGRAYWEYGGEDYLPNDVLPFLPSIAAPASVAGVELLSPRWDLAAEYAELRHPLVLWYSSSSFDPGYAHGGRVLGTPLGGGGERVTLLTRLRSGGSRWEAELRGDRSVWRHPGLPEARRLEAALRLRRLPPGPEVRLRLAWIDEEAGSVARGAVRGDRWLTAAVGLAR
ncbi:MAG: capsule assembly Wzi family protein [Candidatus Krumholzibacteriia bacterium]